MFGNGNSVIFLGIPIVPRKVYNLMLVDIYMLATVYCCLCFFFSKFNVAQLNTAFEEKVKSFAVRQKAAQWNDQKRGRDQVK